MSLVRLEEGSEHSEWDNPPQPMWIHTADEVEYEINRMKSRMEELSRGQEKHLTRGTFGEEAAEAAEEKKIEALTDQITHIISHSQRLITMMSRQGQAGEKRSESRLRENVTNALLLSLSRITEDFRKHQTAYLARIRSRAQNVDDFLMTSLSGDTSAEISLLDVDADHEYSMEELQMMMRTETFVKERENEVLAVNRSILELNSLFKEVSSLVVQQGFVLVIALVIYMVLDDKKGKCRTMVDRIEENIDATSVRVSKAVASVDSAARAQRGDKKMQCIMCLAVAVVVLLLLLIATKF